MAKTIECSLSTKSIDKALKEIEKYKTELLNKEKRFRYELSHIGLTEASIRFTTAICDGVNDSHLTLKPIPNGYAIVAKGKVVTCIEFGTGIYHNPSEPYPNPRPSGIVGIGEYGDGKGGRTYESGEPMPWVYNGKAGANGIPLKNGAVMTKGIPASMPMWYATEEMKNSILKIAREVFK